MRYPPPSRPNAASIASTAIKLPTLMDDLRTVLRSLDWEELRSDVRREAAARLAIVGPVNSGKSTLFNLLEGNRVTCTFSNSNLRATAAPASVSGRVVDSFGNVVSKARISVVDAENGSTRVVMTSPVGYYTIDQLDSGRFYIMTVSAKGYKFADNTRSFTLTDSLADMDFVANP